MDKDDFNTFDLIRYARRDLYKLLLVIIIGMIILLIFYIKYEKNIFFTCFTLIGVSYLVYYLFTYLKNYFIIKKICNYLGIKFGYYPVLWSNLINCILTDEVIALYKNKQYTCFQYRDILSIEISRENKGTVRKEGGVFRRYYIYLKIILKDNKEFKFLMYSNDYTKCRPLHGIRDICPIVLEKNKDVVVIDNSQKGLFDFDFRQKGLFDSR